jgi:hypothetical protein
VARVLTMRGGIGLREERSHKGARKRFRYEKETVGLKLELLTPDTKSGKWNKDAQVVTGERTSNGQELIEISYMKLSKKTHT